MIGSSMGTMGAMICCSRFFFPSSSEEEEEEADWRVLGAAAVDEDADSGDG